MNNHFSTRKIDNFNDLKSSSYVSSDNLQYNNFLNEKEGKILYKPFFFQKNKIIIH